MDAITHKRDVANIRSAASSSDNLPKHRRLPRRTIALSAAEIPRFGVLASTDRITVISGATRHQSVATGAVMRSEDIATSLAANALARMSTRSRFGQG